MKIPPEATSYCPPVTLLTAGIIGGASIRHTFRPRGTTDWLLIYTLSGSGLYGYPGGSYSSVSHDITLYRPGFFQDYQRNPKSKRWDLFYSHFIPRNEWLPWLNWPEKSHGFMLLTLADPDMRRRVVLRVRDILRLNFNSTPRGQILGLNALEEVLLWCDSINPQHRPSQPDPRVQKAMDFLSTHATEHFSEERLMRASGLSPSRLRHLFRLQTGMSPRHFQEEQRLRRAKDLLSMSRDPISEIAFKLGFENPFYFTLRFKKHVGVGPRTFRQQRIGK